MVLLYENYRVTASRSFCAFYHNAALHPRLLCFDFWCYWSSNLRWEISKVNHWIQLGVGVRGRKSLSNRFLRWFLWGLFIILFCFVLFCFELLALQGILSDCLRFSLIFFPFRNLENLTVDYWIQLGREVEGGGGGETSKTIGMGSQRPILDGEKINEVVDLTRS